MYISERKHILSNAIMMAAFAKIFTALCEGGLRFIVKKNYSLIINLNMCIVEDTFTEILQALVKTFGILCLLNDNFLLTN